MEEEEEEQRRRSMGIDYPLSIRNNWLCLSGRRDDTLTRGEPGVKQHRLAGEGEEKMHNLTVGFQLMRHILIIRSAPRMG